MKTAIILILMTTTAYAENSVTIDQVGNNNNTTVIQSAPDANAEVKNKGDNNYWWLYQEGEGEKDAVITDGNNDGAYNSNNSFSIHQSGTGNHSATITMTDPTNNNDNTALITQSGPDKSFTLNIAGSGISATISQINQTTGDSGSMSIQCYTPPCSGYSYSK